MRKNLTVLLALLVTVFCFATVSSFAAAEDYTQERWIVNSKTDDFTDETNVFTAVIDSTGENWILIRCVGGDYLELTLKSSAYSSDGFHSNNLMYRIDKKTAQTTSLMASKYKLQTFDKDHDFIRALMSGGEKLLSRVTGYDGDTSTMRFTLNGAKAAVTQVVEACS